MNTNLWIEIQGWDDVFYDAEIYYTQNDRRKRTAREENRKYMLKYVSS
jgi:hypothetical protein